MRPGQCPSAPEAVPACPLGYEPTRNAPVYHRLECGFRAVTLRRMRGGLFPVPVDGRRACAFR